MTLAKTQKHTVYFYVNIIFQQNISCTFEKYCQSVKYTIYLLADSANQIYISRTAVKRGAGSRFFSRRASGNLRRRYERCFCEALCSFMVSLQIQVFQVVHRKLKPVTVAFLLPYFHLQAFYAPEVLFVVGNKNRVVFKRGRADEDVGILNEIAVCFQFCVNLR